MYFCLQAKRDTKRYQDGRVWWGILLDFQTISPTRMYTGTLEPDLSLTTPPLLPTSGPPSPSAQTAPASFWHCALYLAIAAYAVSWSIIRAYLSFVFGTMDRTAAVSGNYEVGLSSVGVWGSGARLVTKKCLLRYRRTLFSVKFSFDHSGSDLSPPPPPPPHLHLL